MIPLAVMLVLTLPVVALLRAVLGRRVQALMLRRSPASEALPTPLVEGSEVPARTAPQVSALSAEGLSPAADESRLAQTRPARSLFRRSCVYDAVAVVGVLGAWQLYWLGQAGVSIGAWMPTQMGGVYAILIGLRYATYGRAYGGRTVRGIRRPGCLRRWVTVVPEVMFRLAVHPQYSIVPILFFLSGLHQESDRAPGWWYWAALLLAIPVALRRLLIRQARADPNRRLLILRVFGRDANSVLTFGAIRRFWRLVGSTFTIVDRSYVRYKYRGRSESHLVIMFLFYAVLSAPLSSMLDEGVITPAHQVSLGLFLGICLILAYGVAMVVMYVRAPRSFAASLPQIRDRLQGFLRRPRRWDLTFKDLDMYCFDNTWRSAVAAFVTSADVVLMDLRGYSAQNKGCETEVDFLFDTFPVDRLVFLVDNENDGMQLRSLIQRLWAELKVGSPNIGVPEPTVKVYNIGAQSDADVKGLVNVLVAGAGGEPVPT